MTWHNDRLPELLRAMAGRPRHEALRGHVTELLRAGFGARYEEIGHEVCLLDGGGRIDTIWGATVIELKATRGGSSRPPYSRTRRNRSAFPITETELSDIASAATTGLSNTPNAG
jgi:hypothetical protein